YSGVGETLIIPELDTTWQLLAETMLKADERAWPMVRVKSGGLIGRVYLLRGLFHSPPQAGAFLIQVQGSHPRTQRVCTQRVDLAHQLIELAYQSGQQA